MKMRIPKKTFIKNYYKSKNKLAHGDILIIVRGIGDTVKLVKQQKEWNLISQNKIDGINKWQGLL